MKKNYTGGENSINLCWREPHWAPRIAGYEQHHLFQQIWFSLHFSQLGIKVTSLTWVESGVQILKRDWEENRGYQRISQGRSSCRTALGWQNGCGSCSPQLSWGSSALRFASSDKQHPKNSSVGGTSLVCPAQSRDNIPARWDSSGLCPVTFGRAWRQILFL